MSAPRGARAAALAVVATLVVSPLGAQVCEGFPTLRGARMRLSVGAATHRYANSVLVSFAAGRTAYATVDAGRSRDPELDATTLDVALGVGADVPTDRSRVAFLCPRVSIAESLGPNGYLLQDESYRYFEASVGIGLAAELVRGGRVGLFVAGDARVARLAVTNVPGPSRSSYATGWTRSDVYGEVRLRAGLTVGRRVTVRPSLSVPFGFPAVSLPPPENFIVPFGRADGELCMGLSIGVMLGGRGRADRR